MIAEDMLVGTSEFRPFAYYDKNLDAIRVQILDCSVFEERLDRLLTLYYANYPIGTAGVRGSDQIVGFAIKGVRHLFDSWA